MNDTLKRIAYHRLAPIGLVVLAAIILAVLGISSGDSGILMLAAGIVAVVGGYGQVGFGTLPKRRPNLRVL